jgi:hypothetical protein
MLESSSQAIVLQNETFWFKKQSKPVLEAVNSNTTFGWDM